MGAAQAPIRGRGAPVPPDDERAGQPSRDGEEQPETVACFALPAFLFWSYGSYGSGRTGRDQNIWSTVDFGMGSRGEFRTRRVRNTASLPWSPEPRTLNPRAWKGVRGRAPERAARPTVGPSGVRNEVRGGPRTEWRKGVEGRRPRGSRAAPWHVLSEAKG